MAMGNLDPIRPDCPIYSLLARIPTVISTSTKLRNHSDCRWCHARGCLSAKNKCTESNPRIHESNVIPHLSAALIRSPNLWCRQWTGLPSMPVNGSGISDISADHWGLILSRHWKFSKWFRHGRFPFDRLLYCSNGSDAKRNIDMVQSILHRTPNFLPNLCLCILFHIFLSGLLRCCYAIPILLDKLFSATRFKMFFPSLYGTRLIIKGLCQIFWHMIIRMKFVTSQSTTKHNMIIFFWIH